VRTIVAPIMAALVMTPSVPPATYRCTVTRKVDPDGPWSEQRIRDGQWSVVVRDEEPTATLSRCSFAPPRKAVTCDHYAVDRVEADAHVGVRKYYVFRSQYDVQIFTDLSFVENNGRGSVSYGRCQMSPE
jgi:hypothetical protein